jgi:hypothetical protein
VTSAGTIRRTDEIERSADAAAKPPDRLVPAVDALLAAPPDLITALFLKPSTDP